MRFTDLEFLVKENAQKNYGTDVEVSIITKQEIDKYKKLTNDDIENNYISHIRCPFKFRNYSKVVDTRIY